jgi:hypothetical protein
VNAKTQFEKFSGDSSERVGKMKYCNPSESHGGLHEGHEVQKTDKNKNNCSVLQTPKCKNCLSVPFRLERLIAALTFSGY